MFEINHNDNTKVLLTDEFLIFFEKFINSFEDERQKLLIKRSETQKFISNGGKFTFPEDSTIRDGEWKVVPPPADVLNRNVEITGPVDRKMIINALNSGSDVFMADFEDSTSPTWENILNGHLNLIDANKKSLSFENKENGKKYKLSQNSETSLFVRPRGLHLDEQNVTYIGKEVSASLFDFCLYAFHNADIRMQNNLGSYFYLPKLENSKESQLWNSIFTLAETELHLPVSTIRATVLLETISASFEMDEILHSLKDHSLGMNAGRWDYIFSAIKRYRDVKNVTFPDRDQITMTVPFMKAYTELLVESMHKRGAHAIGGMAAFIPDRKNPEITEAAFSKVKDDKIREAEMGFDGSWVAHPDLVPICKEIFTDYLHGKDNQIEIVPNYQINADMLQDFKIQNSTVTENGVRTNIKVGILYIQSWLLGQGAAALFNLMEDAATAEISRSQLWQWLRNDTITNEGIAITSSYVESLIDDEVTKIIKESNNELMLSEAIQLFKDLIFNDDFEDFLTLSAYKFLK
jgi:malate synthase